MESGDGKCRFRTVIRVRPRRLGDGGAGQAHPEPAVAQACGTDLKQEAAALAVDGKSGTATCVRKQTRKAGASKTSEAEAGIAADICGGSLP
ncbi:hypothetical protein AB0L44_14140 [Nonomuraea wenchangensis]|uniref:hypothetical protein n=1 Tax=Nonomuraea wenchangensis TaxID=568860 RepID=UPI00342A7F03